MHPDRYLPNLKIFFYTKNVSLDEAPFSYAVGSHKINRNYLNYYLENESYIFDDRILNLKFLKHSKKFPVKEFLDNSTYQWVSRRAKFKQPLDRTAIFIQYPKYNLISLLRSSFLNFIKFIIVTHA